MDQFFITTAKLIPYPKHTGGVVNFATSFHQEASPALARHGDICVVIEVLAPSKQASEVSSLIIETLRRDYYESTIEDTAERFEQSVKAVNHELATYATHGNSAWIGKVSAVLAIVAGREVHITQTGSAQAYLYRRGNSTCITTGLASKEPHRPSKTFGNIASGGLASGDRLLLATPALMHQLASNDLSEIISDNSAPAAVAKLQQLLKDSDSKERIAATITEVTTTEAAALSPQSGLPKEARLGKAETLWDAAKVSGAPIAKQSLAGLSKATSSMRGYWADKITPRLKRIALTVVKWLRKHLATKQGQFGFLAVIGVIVILVAILFIRGGNNHDLSALAAQYKDAYTKQTTAASQLADGDKLGAKSNYQAALSEVNTVIKNPKSKDLDKYLAKHPHADNDPLSASALRNAITAQIDQIDGLTKVNAGQLADFSALGNAKPTMMEQVGNQFIFVDLAAGSIYRYDQSKAKLDVVANHPASLGHVVAMAASSAGDGVYILNDSPAVLFYALKNSNLTAVSSVGGWPKGKAIASYAGNLYMIASDDSALYKFTPTTAGFGPKLRITLNDPTVLKGAQSLAIDGNIYIGNTAGFSRVLSGVVEKTDLVFPSNLTNPRAIVSVNSGKLLVETDASSNRIGLFSFDGTLQYTRQLEVNDASTVYKASSATTDNTLYALVDQKFVKISY